MTGMRKFFPHEYVAAGWTQRAHARDLSGNRLQVGHPLAMEWCAIGAIQESRLHGFSPAGLVASLVAEISPFESIAAWNDQKSQSQEAVVKTLRGCGL